MPRPPTCPSGGDLQAPLADHRGAIPKRIVVPPKAFKCDAEHDLARARRPSETLLHALDAFKEAADPENDVPQSGSELPERGSHTHPRSLGAADRIGGAYPAALPTRQKPVPVLGHPWPHLREFEILAKSLPGRDEFRAEKWMAILVPSPSQHREG